MRLKLVWEDEALNDLARAAAWSQLQAAEVVKAAERMAEIGWSLGRRSHRFPGLRYLPVPPLGILYHVEAGAFHVVQILDGRQQRELP